MRNILERSSARETAMRVALGAIVKRFLSEFGIRIGSYVVGIGRVQSSSRIGRDKVKSSEKELLESFRSAEISPVRCPDKISSKKWFN